MTEKKKIGKRKTPPERYPLRFYSKEGAKLRRKYNEYGIAALQAGRKPDSYNSFIITMALRGAGKTTAKEALKLLPGKVA